MPPESLEQGSGCTDDEKRICFQTGAWGMADWNGLKTSNTKAARGHSYSMREMVLRGDPATTNEGRAFVASFLDQCNVPEDDTFDILLAVTEAIGNAIRHGCPDREGRITIRCELDQAHLHLEISDDGNGFRFSEDMAELPDLTASSGRGFFLMHELIDDVVIDSSADGTTIRMRHRLQSHAMTA